MTGERDRQTETRTETETESDADKCGNGERLREYCGKPESRGQGWCRWQQRDDLSKMAEIETFWARSVFNLFVPIAAKWQRQKLMMINTKNLAVQCKVLVA